MLTTTYSQVTIANEQCAMQRALRKLQQSIQGAWQTFPCIDAAGVEHVFSRLTRFDSLWHARKVELYLIPRIRETTSEADALLAELDALSAGASRILAAVGEGIAHAYRESSLFVDNLCQSMDLYCHKLLTRLHREESELFPLARRLFSVEEWFAIAAEFLSDDDPKFGRRRQSAAFLPPRPIVPASALSVH